MNYKDLKDEIKKSNYTIKQSPERLHAERLFHQSKARQFREKN